METQPPNKKQYKLDSFLIKNSNSKEIENNIEIEKAIENNENSLNIQVPTDLGENEPAQPIIQFPKTNFGTQLRAFHEDWYHTFPWIEYSISKDSAFCFPCRKFLNLNAEAKYIEATFIKVGFNNWKRAMEPGRGLIKHLESNVHKKVCN